MCFNTVFSTTVCRADDISWSKCKKNKAKMKRSESIL